MFYVNSLDNEETLLLSGSKMNGLGVVVVVVVVVDLVGSKRP